MATQELKKLDLLITTICIPQVFGYINTYTKKDFIKHKRKKINDVNYNTQKMDLIFYKNNYIHDNNFNLTFIYKAENGNYMRRSFTQIGETFELIKEQDVLVYFNQEKSLF